MKESDLKLNRVKLIQFKRLVDVPVLIVFNTVAHPLFALELDSFVSLLPRRGDPIELDART